MTDPGTILMGDDEAIKASYDAMNSQSVDWDLTDKPVPAYRKYQTTLAGSAAVSGPGTFMGKATRTITLEPSARTRFPSG